MDKVLITGADGFFASRFIQYYKEKYQVIGLNHHSLDITDEKETIETIMKYCPTYVVHAAAISDTAICERNPESSFSINARGSFNVAKACQYAKAKLIYLSSDQVYNGNTQAGPYKEECIAVPNTIYGNHKIEAETGIANIIENVVILRLTWLFSLPERDKKVNSNIIWNVVKSALKNEPIKLPANEYRGITYVYDLLKSFDKILGLSSGLYNTGSENNLSTYEIAEIVLKKIGLGHRAKELLIKDTEKYKVENRDLRISNNKLHNQNILFTGTEEAVTSCIDDFQFKML